MGRTYGGFFPFLFFLKIDIIGIEPGHVECCGDFRSFWDNSGVYQRKKLRKSEKCKHSG
jgi:hypothetical protein